MIYRNPKAPFLCGSPRVHYNTLEYVPSDIYPDEDTYILEGTPFTGIAWVENRKTLCEYTFQNGIREGRCVQIYHNGVMAKDGFYRDGEPVGKHISWFESGTISRYEEYDENSRSLLTRDYNQQGTLIKEMDETESWHLRHWTKEGDLLYASQNQITKIFAKNGECLIEIRRDSSSDREAIQYTDCSLYEHAYDLLHEDNNLVQIPIWNWLNSKLDNNETLAKNLLFKLLEHPKLSICENALITVGLRGYQEALPIVKEIASIKRKKNT